MGHKSLLAVALSSWYHVVWIRLLFRQGWEAKVSQSTGATYYYCEATDESTWELPTDAGGGAELQYDNDADFEPLQDTVQMDAETAVRQLPAPS